MFLPMTKQEMLNRGWENPDLVLISGDAYIDHPSFGAAIISRVLESRGFKVCILAQPNWKEVSDFKKFGKPRLGFLITSGVVESMVNHYTVSKKKRNIDVYTPNGETGKRPDRAVIVYSNMARQAYKDVPIILGGIEASLRRLAHYDYWQDKMRRSVLLDSKADILVYGMGETPIIDIAESLNNGVSIKDITFVKGTVFKTKDISYFEHIELPSFLELEKDKINYAKSFKIQNENTDPINARILVEGYGDWYVVQNTPSESLSNYELNHIYDLAYERNYHPIYDDIGHVKAIEEVKNSIIANRGCAGGCNFCALTYHQGRTVQVRSKESILDEARCIIKDKDFKGYINDVGGPTANFSDAMCDKQKTHGTCKHKQCLSPVCSQLKVSHKKYLDILRSLRNLPEIKKVFIRSGIRYDYLMLDKDKSFFKELVKYHISGQLKVAPEHISPKVLDTMGKPQKHVYDNFVNQFNIYNNQFNKKQYIIPYLMSSHPGSDLNSAIELAEYLHKNNQYPEQVQDFYPTPSTMSTVMFYTGVNPLTMEKVYVPKKDIEKKMQRALMQYRNPKNKKLVKRALIEANREDLIGFDKHCLVRP
ncbi:YgiQ family radical SAM protein [Mycoplasmatota bacterium WC44]